MCSQISWSKMVVVNCLKLKLSISIAYGLLNSERKSEVRQNCVSQDASYERRKTDKGPVNWAGANCSLSFWGTQKNLFAFSFGYLLAVAFYAMPHPAILHSLL